MEQLHANKTRDKREPIVTDWRRFSSGLWRIPEGDIAAAYSAESFPKVKTFTHEGTTFTNLGACFSKNVIDTAVDAYQLLVPGTIAPPPKIQYSYQGEKVKVGGREFHLGSKVVFQSANPSIDEWRNLLRVIYAEGGYFACQPTFREFLECYAQEEGNIGKAAAIEMDDKTASLSKLEVLNILSVPPRESVQLDLFK